MSTTASGIGLKKTFMKYFYLLFLVLVLVSGSKRTTEVSLTGCCLFSSGTAHGRPGRDNRRGGPSDLQSVQRAVHLRGDGEPSSEGQSGTSGGQAEVKHRHKQQGRHTDSLQDQTIRSVLL